MLALFVWQHMSGQWVAHERYACRPTLSLAHQVLYNRHHDCWRVLVNLSLSSENPRMHILNWRAYPVTPVANVVNGQRILYQACRTQRIDACRSLLSEYHTLDKNSGSAALCHGCPCQ